MNFLNTGVHSLNFFASFSANQRRRDTLVQTSLSKFHCHVFGMTLIPFFQKYWMYLRMSIKHCFHFHFESVKAIRKEGGESGKEVKAKDTQKSVCQNKTWRQRQKHRAVNRNRWQRYVNLINLFIIHSGTFLANSFSNQTFEICSGCVN